MKLLTLALCSLYLSSSNLPGAQTRNLIIDTDAGSDDLIAIGFLLARADVNIEAITIVNGLAHVPSGAKNVLRLLELAGRTSIPVYLGRETPLNGSNEFPELWRMMADELPHVELPQTDKIPGALSALAFLRGRLANPAKPVAILALGPLTNIAEVLSTAPNSVLAIEDLVVMGGAVRVPGNLAAGGSSYSDNRTAEWNIFVDATAARKVFDTVTKLRLVPLDASNTVPIDNAFLLAVKKSAKSKLGLFAAQVLDSNRALIEQRIFYAWDPLAAAAIVNPAVLKISSVALTIRRDVPEEGRTSESDSGRSLRVALSADPVLFLRVFLAALR